MTSKEVLQDLRCMTSLSQDCPYKESNDLCDIIEKDLEVLEIIKKKPEYLIHVIIHKDYKSFIDSYIKRFPNVLTETEFNLIKEWLEK